MIKPDRGDVTISSPKLYLTSSFCPPTISPDTAMLRGLLVLLLPGFLHCFNPLLSSDSTTHRVISQRAILRKTAEVCRDIAVSAGQDFTLTVSGTWSGFFTLHIQT